PDANHFHGSPRGHLCAGHSSPAILALSHVDAGQEQDGRNADRPFALRDEVARGRRESGRRRRGQRPHHDSGEQGEIAQVQVDAIYSTAGEDSESQSQAGYGSLAPRSTGLESSEPEYVDIR